MAHMETWSLHVVTIHVGTNTELSDDQILKPSSRLFITLDYEALRVDRNTTSLSWFFSPVPNSSCIPAGYRIEVYTQSDINSAQSQATPVHSQDSSGSMTSLATALLENNCLRIVALDAANSACKKSPYFYCNLHKLNG